MDISPNQTHNDQQRYQKVFNISNHQENANRNHNEALPVRMALLLYDIISKALQQLNMQVL